jgi:hypothetical protein
MVFASSFSGQSADAATTTAAESMSAFLNSDQYTVQQKVSAYFADIPVMQDIAWCESKDRQYNLDGSVYLGEVVKQDIGVMQINSTYHGKTAAKLGLDITTLEGNLMYARYLYVHQGTKPWSASEKCWQPRQLASAK